MSDVLSEYSGIINNFDTLETEIMSHIDDINNKLSMVSTNLEIMDDNIDSLGNIKTLSLLYSNTSSVTGSAGSWATANVSYTANEAGDLKLLMYANGQDGNNNKYQTLYKNDVLLISNPTYHSLVDITVASGDVIRLESKSSFGSGTYMSISQMAVFKEQ